MQKEVYEFISKQTSDPIIEWRTCAISGKEFPIFQSDKEFYEKISPTFGGRKYMIPFPTLCPEERQRRRLMFRNERKLYKRVCDYSNETIVSIYHPLCPASVYKSSYWWSDVYDPLEYGKDIDFNKSCRQQFYELLLQVPRNNLIGDNNEFSDYVNFETDEKNCYMTFGGHRNEDCMYGNYFIESRDCIDGYWNFACQQCYDVIYCFDCYECIHLQDSKQCRDVFLGYDLENCENCIGCVGLRHAKYCILNRQYTFEEYKKIKNTLHMNMMNISKDIWEKFNQLINQTLKPQWVQVGCEDCIGDELTDSSNLVCCFSTDGVQDCRYSNIFGRGKDCMDLESVGLLDLSYEVISAGTGDKALRPQHNMFASIILHSSNMYYCINCYNSHDCFLCTGLKGQKYCILNKQYTKEEYERLVPQIIEHMQSTGERGEFFHSSLSPFGYNETVAQEYFPLTREEALERGYTWQDKEYPIDVPEGMATISGKNLPNTIEEVDDSLLQKAIVCEVSGKPFRIIKPELIFYRKHNLPLPRKHPDIRHQERLAKRPGRELFLRHCDRCGKEMLSVYKSLKQQAESRERKEKQKVYCENCYQREVYG